MSESFNQRRESDGSLGSAQESVEDINDQAEWENGEEPDSSGASEEASFPPSDSTVQSRGVTEITRAIQIRQEAEKIKLDILKTIADWQRQRAMLLIERAKIENLSMLLDDIIRDERFSDENISQHE